MTRLLKPVVFVIVTLVALYTSAQLKNPDGGPSSASTTEARLGNPEVTPFEARLLESVNMFCDRPDIQQQFSGQPEGDNQSDSEIETPNIDSFLPQSTRNLREALAAEERERRQQDLLMRSFRFSAFFKNNMDASVQPGCYVEPGAGKFTGGETFAVLLEASGIDIGDDIHRSGGILPLPIAKEDTAGIKFEVFLVTLKVKNAEGPRLKPPVFRYSIVMKKPGDAEDFTVLWGPYALDVPREPFTGKLIFFFMVRDTPAMHWDTIYADYTPKGFATLFDTKKPSEVIETTQRSAK